MLKALFFLLLGCTLIPAQMQPLTSNTSTLFAGAGKCESCHSSDGTALTLNSLDVSMITHWRSTMMANAAEDPLWRAKVSAEVTEHPALSSVIETKCTSCHAPMGYKQNQHDGVDTFSIAEMEGNALALDGVSCTGCHQIQPYNFGTMASYSGGYSINDTGFLWGPYNITRNMVGYTANYGAHIDDAELCATCHMLFTPFVDDTGAVAGEFPEQTPYYEWLNSSLSPATTCQDCHMPSTDSTVKIASGSGSYQTPFWFHHFVGANVFNQQILRDNIHTLQLSADTTHFDSTRQRTENHLRNNAATLTAACQVSGSDLTVNVAVTNQAGHKLPTGIPIRRLWLYLSVADSNGQTVFESGAWDTAGKIEGKDDPYESHHDEITDSLQVQVYEAVMQDINDTVTYTLLRAASYVKDNRIPPAGFTTLHAKYDTIPIVGAAASDNDFNLNSGAQGTGADSVRYTINVATGMQYTVTVKLCYQSVVPAFADHLITFSTDEATEYAAMYGAQNRDPIVIDSVSVPVDVPVPVVLSSFTAQIKGNEVELAWTTESETDNLGFHVLRSTEETGPYLPITANLIAGQGTTAFPRTYQFTDPEPPAGTVWYRLEQVDIAGSKWLSAPVSVEMPVRVQQGLSLSAVTPLLRLSNPSRKLTFDLASPEILDITLYGMDGTEYPVVSGAKFSAGSHTVDLLAIRTTGIYLLTCNFRHSRVTTRILVLP